MAASKTNTDFFKFLRTRHIFDAGGNGVTRDDLLLTSKEAQTFLKGNMITLEEKVDGANIGISIDKDYTIKVQNRSHYINSSSHKQFSTLDAWIDKHSEDLLSVLTPGKHILFGEWLFAKHSIHYTSIPDYFLAFDIFDKSEKRFFSIVERNKLLKETSINCTREICQETNPTKKRLLQLLDTPSSYYNGSIEGLILRHTNDTGETVDGHYFQKRAKIVRPDFLQQIEEQWTKQKFEKNRLLFY